MRSGTFGTEPRGPDHPGRHRIRGSGPQRLQEHGRADRARLQAPGGRHRSVRNGSTEVQTAELEHWEETGENEIVAILAGFEKKTTVSAEASGGVKGIGEAQSECRGRNHSTRQLRAHDGTQDGEKGRGQVYLPPAADDRGRGPLDVERTEDADPREGTWRTPDQVQGHQSGGDHFATRNIQRSRRRAQRRGGRSWTTGSPIIFENVCRPGRRAGQEGQRAYAPLRVLLQPRRHKPGMG